MLDVVGTGPVMGAWPGFWEMVLSSPDLALGIIGALAAMALAGITLIAFGSIDRLERPRPAAVVVPAPRPARRARRRR